MEKLEITYKTKYKPELKNEFELDNINQVADLDKVSINMGFGNYKDNKEFVAEALDDLAQITGQKASPRYAKKAISTFKLREGELIGASVTLRGDKAWDFLEKIIKIVLPAVRDFRGLGRKSFDKNGNYCFGITEHFVFPEINGDKVKYIKGLQVNISTTTKDDTMAARMLEMLGFPFIKTKATAGNKKIEKENKQSSNNTTSNSKPIEKEESKI